MTRKPVGKDEVLNLMMRPNYSVLVKGVIGVMACPTVDELDGFELWNASCNDRPNLLLPDCVILGEVIIIHRLIVIWGAAGQIIAAF